MKFCSENKFPKGSKAHNQRIRECKYGPGSLILCPPPLPLNYSSSWVDSKILTKGKSSVKGLECVKVKSVLSAL